MSSAAAAQVRALVAAAVAAAALDLEDVLVRSTGSRRLVQVLVDRDGGVDLDAVAQVSRACSEVLDEADLFGGAYDLEVSSPGVDRPLTQPRHWRRNVGRLVQIRLADGKDLTGRIVAADDIELTVQVGKAERRLAYPEVARGVVQLEFTRVQAGEVPSEAETDEAS